MKIRNLSLCYEEKELFRDFCVDLEDDEITVIMGNSGVGKSTLLNCIADLSPYTGEITGVEGVSYVFQEPRLIEPLTVYDNLLYVLGGKDTEQNREKIMNIVQKVELDGELSTFAHELSGGMKSRVALARAFLHPSKTLLMDEAMHSLDLGLKLRLGDTLKKLLSEDNRTTLYVTHDVDEAIEVGDRIIMLDGSPVEVVGDYRTADYDKDELRGIIADKLVKM